MIQAVIFDMDGVLVDAKDWHYEALNAALALFGVQISRDEHLAFFDGLPTKNKLQVLGASRNLPKSLHPLINQLKQKYTLDIVLSRCRPVFHVQYALAQLRRSGYRIAVCSNSVRLTVDTMMERSALSSNLEFTLSNEDVAKPKPDPEIYQSAMRQLGLDPQHCMIVEDNDHGILAARASGAHVHVVSGQRDVTHAELIAAIHRFESAVGVGK